MIARLLLLLALSVALPLNAQELPAGFGWFRNVVGYCWVGLLPDGTTEHTHCYTSQFGRFIRGTSTLVQTKGGNKVTAFEGDSLFAWDDKERRIVYYMWASDGSHRQLNAELSGDELLFPVPTRTDPAKISYRSVWRMRDAESIEVRRERPDASSWKTEFTVPYRRVPRKDN